MSKQEEIIEDKVTTEEAVEGSENTPNALLISLELAEAIVKYLTSQPMSEVESLVSALRKSRAVTVTSPPEEETEA